MTPPTPNQSSIIKPYHMKTLAEIIFGIILIILLIFGVLIYSDHSDNIFFQKVIDCAHEKITIPEEILIGNSYERDKKIPVHEEQRTLKECRCAFTKDDTYIEKVCSTN